MTGYDDSTEEDSATDHDDASTYSRHQVLGATAAGARVPLWASHSEHTRAAYTCKRGGDGFGTTMSAIFAGIEMYQEPENDIALKIEAYTGDQEYPEGMVGLKFDHGAFVPSITLSTQEARELARTLTQAAQDAEVMTQAEHEQWKARTR